MLRFFTALILFLVPNLYSNVYYIDSDAGSDDNDGRTESRAWKSLLKASSVSLSAGDQILLKAGQTHLGKLKFVGVEGTEEAPIVIASYGDGEDPLIDAAGYLAGVHFRDAKHVLVKDLEITADGGVTVDGESRTVRYGVFVDVSDDQQTFSDIEIRDLYIHDIFPERDREHEGRNPTTYVGTGISLRGGLTECSGVLVENCRIEETGFKAIELFRLSDAEVLGNQMKNIGGPAIQPGRVNDLLVRDNVVDGSGAYTDSRMHGRGSGIWPWTSNRILIERNKFMHARGRGDTCGVHIDFNCSDVVVQYNLSWDNEGGFLEILGNNWNCAYRYNVSIDDGARVNGEGGATQWGHTLWLSSYTGTGNLRKGPFNTYIYNNTIYTRPDLVAKFDFSRTSDGVLIANNIFYIEGDTANVYTNWENSQEPQGATPQNYVWRNNLYLEADVLPEGMPADDSQPLIGNPVFYQTGGSDGQSYIPTATDVVEDRGIVIEKLDGDDIGLRIGLTVTEDFFGNPIVGMPDLGAVEVDESFLDTDRDRILDAVERRYGLDPLDPADAALDLDVDGFSNESEFRAGTRLDDAHDRLPIEFEGDKIQLEQSRVQTDRLYLLEHSSDLGESDPWKVIDESEATAASGSNALSLDLDTQTPMDGFYRLRVEWAAED